MIEAFKITNISEADKADKRGSTYEWKQPEGTQVTIYKRKAGSKSKHFHKGKDPSKNPERFFLIKGKVHITFELKNERLKKILTAGTEILIYPNVVHIFEALENSIYIEYRLTHFNPKSPDTYEI